MKRTDPREVRAAIAEPYRSAVLPKLELIAEAGNLAEQQAWVDTGWPAGPVAPSFADTDGDAIVVQREDVRDLREAPYVPVRCTTLDFDPVRVAIQMLGLAYPERGVLDAPNPEYYVRHLKQVARARYALIVVTHEIRMPEVEVAKFVTGMVRGAALLFELATRELHGAFMFAAENSWQLKASDRTIEDKLRDDLDARFSKAIVRGIEERFPDGRAPETLGYL